MADLIIKGGRVVVADTVVQTDVVIAGGRIAALQADAPVTGSAEVIDARGKFILPGSIDPHVHILWPYSNVTTNDNFFSASRAAALGGTTMFIDWALQYKGDPAAPEGQVLNAFRQRRAQIDGDTALDYSLHQTLTVSDDATLAAIPPIIEQGVAVFKLYMTYRKRGIMTDDGMLWDVLQANRGRGTVVSIHAENAAIHELKERQMKARGTVTPADWAQHKGEIVESEAVHRALYLAERVGTPVLIRHMTTADGVDTLRQARRRGFPALGETCPQYLVLDDRVFARPDANRFICSPPIRSADHVAALWRALADGTIDIIGSDHAAFTAAQKQGDGSDAFTVPNGLPGIETRFPLLFSEGFAKGRLSLPRLAALTATNAAKLYGLYPRKGVLLPGSDADIVIVDPQRRRTLRASALHMAVDFSPYEGMELQGYPLHTLSRGRVVVRDGEFCGERGAGQWVPSAPGGWKALQPQWAGL